MKNTELKPRDPYAPGANGSGTSDPVRLATITMRAVDEIGNATAAGFEQIATAIEAAAHEEAKNMRAYAAELTRETEKGAAAIEAGAKAEAERLRQLAAATRGRSSIESERVSDFCTMSKTVLEGIRDLEVQIVGRPEAGADDGEEVPRFLKKGPANGATADMTALN